MGSNEENMFNCSLVSKNNLEYILATGKDFICEEYDIKQKDSEKFEDSEECRNTYVKHWTDEFHNKKMSPEALFGYCTYSSIAATATSIGILGASKRNDVEFLICIVVMLFNLFIMNGVFLGAFTSVQIDGYRRRTLFGTRLNLILQQVDHRNVSKKLAKKIRTWYYNFWMKESAIHKLEASDLLPESMINDIELDKYWHTLNQSLILRHVSDGMKRALAQKMETYYYSKGDVIVYQDQLQNKIIFVATGVVQVVAPDDIESPIINLGYGSCIGESYMLLNIPNAAHILIANSHELHAVKQKQLQLSRKRVDKTLKLIKQVLRSSFEDIQTDKTDLKTTDLYIINKIEGSTKHKDMIFVTTNWPWILYPNSQLLQIWNGLIFIISVAVAIVYPYVLFYLKTSPPFYDVFLRPVANILFIADVIVQIFTAVEDDKQNMNSTLSGIISKRFTQLNFLIDVASIIPIEILYKGILTYDRRNNIFDCNHMLKIIRIVSFFVNLTKSFKFGTNVTRIFLYVVYLTYLGYLQGLFYYLAGCSSRQKYVDEVSTVRKFMISNKMKRRLLNRLNLYMESQWEISEGIKVKHLMFDIPKYFYEKLNKDRYYYMLESIPLFKLFSRAMIRMICGKCEIELFPPNEYVTYAGDTTQNMYIIEKGFCEMLFSGSNRADKIVGPMTDFCVIDMLLEVPVLYNIRTLTNVSVLKISLADIDNVMSYKPELKGNVHNLIAMTKNTIAVKRLFMKSGETWNVPYVKRVQQGSFFRFPNGKLHPLNLDFQRGWRQFTLLRYFMRRKTILPNGPFLYRYAIFHAVIVFAMCTINPCLFVYQCAMKKIYAISISLFLDLLLLIDVYIRLHVCYYNEDGVLVTHPKYTATHYITTSFTVDLLTALPLKLIFEIFLGRTDASYINLIKVLRVYRIPNAFSYCEKDILKNKDIWLSIVKYLILTTIIFNTLTAILILLGCKYTPLDEVIDILMPYNSSWVFTIDTDSELSIKANRNSNAMKIYYLALYYITQASLKLGIGDIAVVQNIEVIYTMLVVIFGYVWFTYILVTISNTKAALNLNLTIYQNHMKDLIIFMKEQRVPKLVQNKNIRFFEYMWQRTQGTNTMDIFDNFHTTLKGDCVLSMYQDTLALVSIFQNADASFFRALSMLIKEAYYLQDMDICCINNIVDSVYIVHRGVIKVTRPDGHIETNLRRGAFKLTKSEIFYMSRTMELISMLGSYFSYLIIIYHASFQHHKPWVIALTFFFDFMQIVKIYITFKTPYISRLGEIVKNKKRIKNKYLKESALYFDLFSLIPFEFFSFAFPTGNIWLYVALFRLNRVVRLISIKRYFGLTYDYLNVNVLAIKLFSLFVFCTTFTHTKGQLLRSNLTVEIPTYAPYTTLLPY
ncbi:PREDICTED: uncharacterized protein LOC108559859 [Nicrophorus vespilloides]|uniref:Uncharacterized protein LOC108559859 n=1 Tax=Nicrophorus vespilloides TaxID=110193 RepID=A0ABM1MDR6_NICVS|nr:PREDICTED: uncharacterized protein LOC108559859 [Nicrophorus vespilloides]